MEAIVSKETPDLICLTKLCALSCSPRDLCDRSNWTLLFIMVIDLRKIRSEYCLIEWDGAFFRQGVTDNLNLNQSVFSLYCGPKATTHDSVLAI